MKASALIGGLIGLALLILMGCASPTSQSQGSKHALNSTGTTVPPVVGNNTGTGSGGTSPGTDPPNWLTSDLELAHNVQFPVTAATYALDLSIPGATSMGPLVLDYTSHVWIGGFTGQKSESDFSFYGGSEVMQGTYQAIVQGVGSRPLGPITEVLVLEDKDGGMGHLVPAMCLDLSNGMFLAFATNQVITLNNHAGYDQYTVYPVQGIKIPMDGAMTSGG